MERDPVTGTCCFEEREKLAITSRSLHGDRLRDIARDYGTSVVPIQQIVHAMCRAAHPHLYLALGWAGKTRLSALRDHKEEFLSRWAAQRYAQEVPPCG